MIIEITRRECDWLRSTGLASRIRSPQDGKNSATEEVPRLGRLCHPHQDEGVRGGYGRLGQRSKPRGVHEVVSGGGWGATTQSSCSTISSDFRRGTGTW